MTDEIRYAAMAASLEAENAQHHLGGTIEGYRVYEQCAARLQEAAGNVAISGAQIHSMTDAAWSVSKNMGADLDAMLNILGGLPADEVQDIINAVKAAKLMASMVVKNGIEPARGQFDELEGIQSDMRVVIGQLATSPDVANGSYADIQIGVGLLHQLLASL